MQKNSSQPGLYGITSENSNRSGGKLWGKNRFNSTFPLALCLYMRDSGIKPVSVKMKNGQIESVVSAWDMDYIIGKKADKVHYYFEESFQPYKKFYTDDTAIDKIDLVVKINNKDYSPYEIKLTVVPDNSTAKKLEQKWAPEIVLRPVSSAHAMMKVASSLCKEKNKSTRNQVVYALKKAHDKIDNWSNAHEVFNYRGELYTALRDALKYTEKVQEPFLIQPIWRTRGQPPEFCDKCFDVFVWSDVAVMGIPVLEHNPEGEKGLTSPSRKMREIARHVRSLYDILQKGNYSYRDTFNGMSLSKQTDKAFAISGSRSIRYLSHKRLSNPELPKDVIKKIVLNGGESMLKPERRLDAVLQAHMMRTVRQS